MQYVKSVWGKIILRTEICGVPWEIRFGNLLNINFVRKQWFSTRTLHQLSTSDEKILLHSGKIEKPYLVYLNDEIPAICFFKLGAWHAAKTRACLVRSSPLKGGTSLNSNAEWAMGRCYGSEIFLSPDHVRVRRGFRSYFYNYLDEIAMATCAAIPSNGPGLIYAVRRWVVF